MGGASWAFSARGRIWMTYLVVTGFVGTTFATDTPPPGVDSQVQAIWELINKGDRAGAAAAVDELLATAGAEVVKPARDLAWGFSSKLGDYDKAFDIYWRLIRDYPDAPEIVWVYGSYAKAHLDQGQINEALQVVAPLLGPYYSTFEQHYEALSWVAWEFQQAQVWDQAAALYTRLIELHPTDARTCRARADLAWTWLKAGKPTEADTVLDALLASGCDDSETLQGVENCAWIYRRDYSSPDKALDIYHRFVAAYPMCERAVHLWRCIIETHIETGDKPLAVENLNRMQVAFQDTPRAVWAAATGVVTGTRLNDPVLRDAFVERLGTHTANPDFSAAVTYVLEQYQDRFSKLGRPPTADECLEPAAIYEQIMQAAPRFVPEPKTAFLLALCYQCAGQPDKATVLYNKGVVVEPAMAHDYEKGELALAGDYYCGAYVAWHLLRHFGRTTPIEEIVEAMGIRRKGYSTVLDIVDYLESRQIPAQPMVIPADKLASLDRPFIQYLVPLSGGDLGHFVLVIPSGGGKAVLLDGPKDPVRIDLASYSNDEHFWDGTILLIQRSRQEVLEEGLTQQVSWHMALAMAECWLREQNGSVHCFQWAQSYYRRTLDERLWLLKGGCADLDCVPNGQTCYTVPPCDDDDDCLLAFLYCDDRTDGKRCMVGYGGYIPCITLTPHTCQALQRLTGACDTSKHRCFVYHNGTSPCGTTNVPQCRDWWW